MLAFWHLIYNIAEAMPRKTRKQKEKAQKGQSERDSGHPYEALVKREFHFSQNLPLGSKKRINIVKKSDKSVPAEAVFFVKRDLLKTIVLTSLILALETVLYLIWFK